MSDSYETKADPPVDPSVTIVNDLLYGDPDESGSKLRSFVQNEAVAAVQGHAFAQRRSAEIAAGHRWSPSSRNENRCGRRCGRRRDDAAT